MMVLFTATCASILLYDSMEGGERVHLSSALLDVLLHM